MQLSKIKNKNGWTVYLRDGLTVYRGDSKTLSQAIYQALRLAVPERN